MGPVVDDKKGKKVGSPTKGKKGGKDEKDDNEEVCFELDILLTPTRILPKQSSPCLSTTINGTPLGIEP